MIVIMPAIPAFAGDLRLDEALSTRAIMEFSNNSINRGGNSIALEIMLLVPATIRWISIRSANLRNYDRTNASAGAVRKLSRSVG